MQNRERCARIAGMRTELYVVIAYYYFGELSDPHKEVREHKIFFKDRDITSRIYISEKGINGQMSAARADALAYIEWMQARPEFKDIHFKLSPHHEQVFPKQTVKYRKQLVAYTRDVDLTNRGEYVEPKRWKEMLEDKDSKVLIDVRNDYEWKVGHFEGAELPDCETFREFEVYADELKSKVDPQKTPVMMYCTGGIRCELYSSILKERGFDQVFQLQGGVINYGMEQGNKHWKGKLFVFDDRLVTPISDDEAPAIANCHLCGKAADTYYNCANMDCNELFISCLDCLKKLNGCCGEPCTTSSRVRPYHEDTVHKPFRKSHNYFPHTQPSSCACESASA